MAKNSPLVVKAELIDKKYILDKYSVFSSKKKLLENKTKNHFGYAVIMTIAIQETLKGKTDSNTLEIIGGTIISCSSTFDSFTKGLSYIFILNKSDDTPFYSDYINDFYQPYYDFAVCGTSSAYYNPETQKIEYRHRKRNKMRKISIHRFKRRIA